MPRVKRWDSTRAAQALAPGTGGKGRRFPCCCPPSQLRSGASECGEDSDGGSDVDSGKYANWTRAFRLANWVRPEPPPCGDWQAAFPGSRGLWESVRTLARTQVFRWFGTLGLMAGGSLPAMGASGPGGLHSLASPSRGALRGSGRGQGVWRAAGRELRVSNPGPAAPEAEVRPGPGRGVA